MAGLISTFAATALGGAASLAGVWWTQRTQRTSLYEQRLNEACAQVVLAAHRRAESAARLAFELSQAEMDAAANGQPPEVVDEMLAGVPLPDDGELKGAMQVVVLTCRDGERPTARRIAAAFDAALERPRPKVAEAIAWCVQLLVDWRSDSVRRSAIDQDAILFVGHNV